MLRLPQFELHTPASIEAAAALLAELQARGEQAKLIAGGTDLLPNMKHEITTPAHVVALADLGLDGVELREGELHLGAMVTIQRLADDPLVERHLPALREACAAIAGPQLRRMGTLGGNICLDTRCLYVNQTYFWRQALGFCLKRDGSVCHVVAGGQNCVAAASNDSVLPLMLYDARVVLRSASGAREVALREFFSGDGIHNKVIEPTEILTHVVAPVPRDGVRCAFEKLRVRKSIDFPLSNVAALVERDAQGRIERLELVVSALGPKPKRIVVAAQGKRLDDDTLALAARKAHAACRPLTNLATDTEWRRSMIPVLIKRALRRLA